MDDLSAVKAPGGRSADWTHLAVVVTAIALSLVSTAAFVRFSFRWASMDYETFWVAARMPLAAIYSGPRFTFVYPPTAIPFLWPLGETDYWTGYAGLTILSAGAFFLATRKSCGRTVAALSLLSFPAIEGLMWGQPAMLLAAGLFAALWLEAWRKGFAIGVLAVIKPQLFLAAPFVFIVRKDYSAIGGMIAGAMMMAVLSNVLLGSQPWNDWLAALPAFLSEVFARNIPGIASPLGVALDEGWQAWPFAVGSLLLAGWLIVGTRHATDPAIISAAIGGASIICSPYALFHDCILVVPVAASILLRRRPAFNQLPAMLVFGSLAMPIALPALLAMLGLRSMHTIFTREPQRS